VLKASARSSAVTSSPKVAWLAVKPLFPSDSRRCSWRPSDRTHHEASGLPSRLMCGDQVPSPSGGRGFFREPFRRRIGGI